MEMLTNAVNWFEIPVTDFARAKQFYSTIYDYEMPEYEMGPIKMGILLYEQSQGVGGAICYGEGYEPSDKGTKVYLNGGSDLNVVLSRVPGAGGSIIMEKTSIGENGYMALFHDTEGNLVALHSMQ
ncbi:MAG: VOC family protein [Saprospiraceae bacterium]